MNALCDSMATSKLRYELIALIIAVVLAALFELGFLTTNRSHSNTSITVTTISISPSIRAWNATTNYPIGISGQSCVSSDNYIYCVGGYNSSSGGVSNVYYAPFTSDGIGKWNATNSYPAGTFSPICVSSDNYIYCVGGYNNAGGTENGVYYTTA